MKTKKLTTLSALIFGLLFFMVTISYSQENNDRLTANDLTKLTFEELMQVQIKSASLTAIERIKTPGTITTITREDIELTPYRNLLDLLEVYVPSGTFVNHWLGPRIGINGVISDQNNSYLLLVDGEKMNLNFESGAVFEIQNKDLSDIEKIEITSGPGSVIHGPGAIGGVISITTKNAKTCDKSGIGVKHDFTYRYSILNGNYVIKKKKFSAYMFASFGKSDGIKEPEFYYVDRAHGYGYGYMSETWGKKGLGSAAPNFYSDFDNRPEIKAQLNINFFKEFTLSARYTNFSFTKQSQQAGSQEGPAFPGIYGQQFSSIFKNNHKFSEKIQLVSSAGFQSQSHGDIALYQRDKKPFDDISQRKYSFSEKKISLRSVLSFQPYEKLKLAIGSEYNYWFYGTEWGKEKNSLILDFPSPILFAITDTTSGFYATYNQNNIVTLIDKRINANQISGFFEVNYQPIEKTTVLVSGRIDKHNLAEVAFSPRVALIQQISNNNYLKVIGQQSVRLPNFRELYAINYAGGNPSAPEKLRGFELIFTRVQNKNLIFNVSAFHQSIDQIAWIDSDKSGVIGTFNTAGFEIDASYKLNRFSVAFSYSYIRQIDWKAKYEAEYYLSKIGPDSIDMPLIGAGENRINNFPKHQLKFNSSFKIKNSLFIHLDGRFAAKQEQMDMLNMFKDVHDNYGLEHTRNEMQAIFDDLIGKGYGKASFTSNLSIRYTLPFKKLNLSLSAYVMNIFSVNHIRYVYQFWEYDDCRQYPRQVGFINEPISFALKLNVKL
ncbi:MAG: TonB-dependent receptor [Bacteroidales bacterium]|nr:TonB-dependent receptor [Bacteroidales bacterium]